MFCCYFSVAVKHQRSQKYKVQKTIPDMHTLKPKMDRESTHWRTFNAPLDNQGWNPGLWVLNSAESPA